MPFSTYIYSILSWVVLLGIFSVTIACRDVQGQSGISLMGSSGYQVTPICGGVPQDYPRTSLLGFSRQVTLTCRGVQGQSCDVPEILCTSGHTHLRGCSGQSQGIPVGILWISSHLSMQGGPRTVLGCLSWDPQDIKPP